MKKDVKLGYFSIKMKKIQIFKLCRILQDYLSSRVYTAYLKQTLKTWQKSLLKTIKLKIVK